MMRICLWQRPSPLLLLPGYSRAVVIWLKGADPGAATTPCRNPRDYYPSGKRFLLRFREKGGKEKDLPVHHKLEELLDQYLKATGLEKEPQSPLFPAALGKTGKLSRRAIVRTDAADMLKRRLKQAGLPAHYSPHSFRATGITNFLENDGTLEAAQRIAGHADSRTTKLYDRRGQKVLLEDMERIRY